MALGKLTLSGLILRIALACFLIVSGILTLQLDSGLLGKLQAGFAGNEVANAVHAIAKGDLASLIIVLIGVLQLVSGIFLIAGFFVDASRFNSIALTIILIMWLVVIFIVDIIGKGGLLGGAFKNMNTFLSFLKFCRLIYLCLARFFLPKKPDNTSLTQRKSSKDGFLWMLHHARFRISSNIAIESVINPVHRVDIPSCLKRSCPSAVRKSIPSKSFLHSLVLCNSSKREKNSLANEYESS